MCRKIPGGTLLIALAIACFLVSGVGAKDARAAVAVFDGVGMLTNPEEAFRHNNPPPKGMENAPIPKVDAYNHSGFPPLMSAVSANDKAEVIRLLQRKANPDIRNVYGRTPLEAAADRGNLEIAALLVKHGAKASQGYPLHYAANAAMKAFLQKHGATETGAPPRRYRPRVARPADGPLLDSLLTEEKKNRVPQSSIPVAVLLGRSQEEIAGLIKRGSDINEVHPAFGTALHQAMFQGYDTEFFTFLLHSGADPNLASPYGPPLEEAVDAGREELACLLLKAGAAIRNPDGKKKGETVFHKAVSQGMPEAVRLMLAAGADPNEYIRDSKGRKTEPPIFLTASPGILRLLFAAGADPKAENQNGENALADLPWTEKTIPAAMALLDGGVSGTHPSILKEQKRTLIHWAVLGDSRDLFQAARKAGVSVTERDSKKGTPLLEAVHRGNAWFVRELLRTGAPVNGSASYLGQLYHDEDSFHRGTDDLLAQAVKSNSLAIVEILINAGVTLNTRSNTYYQGTALHLAIEANRPDMVAALLAAQARTDVTDRYGRTPLHWAVKENNAAMVEMLLKAGADPSVTDKDGNTLLEIARGYARDPAIIRLLEKR